MEILVVAGDFEENIVIKEADRLVQRRIDLPTPATSTASEVNIYSVGEGHGCAVVQVLSPYCILCYYYHHCYHHRKLIND